jgi:hypothetical protein
MKDEIGKREIEGPQVLPRKCTYMCTYHIYVVIAAWMCSKAVLYL